VISPRQILDQLAALGIEPTGVADDSRQVQAGDLFLAYPGDLADGRRYIADAIARGAVAVLWQPGGDFVWNSALTAANLPIEDLRAMAGPLAHAVYGHPSEGLSLIAITGTNGKTTVSQCHRPESIQSPAPLSGRSVRGFPDALDRNRFHHPGSDDADALSGRVPRAGAAACALEASSIGIEEGRMNGVRVDVAVFTNFTRDHLDYHGSMEAYAAAKEKLFSWPRLRTAIINLDDELGAKLARETTAMRVLGYAIGEPRRDFPALVRAENLLDTPFGQRFTWCCRTVASSSIPAWSGATTCPICWPSRPCCTMPA
jgi:murE/murF fusion protein